MYNLFNIQGIANYCIQEVKSKVESSERKSKYEVFYASVYEDNSIVTSCTPYILLVATSYLNNEFYQC